MYDYRARVERIVDGDTMIVTIDQGMNIRSSQSLRLLRVYAPERSSGKAGSDATHAVADWVAGHYESNADWALKVITHKDARTFNRYLAEVVCVGCGDSLNDHLRDLGYTDQGTGAPKPLTSSS
jgi:micrococcal nuclease